MAAQLEPINKLIQGLYRIGVTATVRVTSTDGISFERSDELTSVGVTDSNTVIRFGDAIITLYNTGGIDQIRISGINQYANDGAAAAAGIVVGGLYVNSGTGAVSQRLV